MLGNSVYYFYFIFPSRLNKYSPGSFFPHLFQYQLTQCKLRFPLWNYLFISLSWEHPEVTNFKATLPKSV